MTAIPHPESAASKLSIEGEVARPLALDRRALAALDPAMQVADVGALVPGKKGRAVRLSGLAKSAGLRASARHLHIASDDPTFAVSVPISELLDTALVVFDLDGAPLSREKGGPFRLVVPGHPDECVNVKQLASLTFAADPGRDTRPKDDAEHARLHARAAASKPAHPANTAHGDTRHGDARRAEPRSVEPRSVDARSVDARRDHPKSGDSQTAGTKTDGSSRPATKRP